MESTELVSDNQEHAERLLGVLDFREEIGIEAEGKSNFGGLVEVGLEDVLVEDEESFEDLEFVFVGGGLADLVVKLLVREDLLGLETLVGECGHELGFVCLRVMNHSEVDIEMVNLQR